MFLGLPLVVKMLFDVGDEADDDDGLIDGRFVRALRCPIGVGTAGTGAG